MRNMRSIILAAFLCFALAAAGCAPAATSPDITTGPAPASTQSKGQDLMADIKAASWESITAAPDDSYVASVRHFAANLLCESIKNKGNVMVSPASVFLALAMTLNGADGTTREAMLNALASQDLDVKKVDEGSRNWAAALSRTGPKAVLSIASSIWFRQGFDPDQAFLQTNADYFKAGARALDFSDKASADIINGWVRDATNNTIKEIIDQISPEAVMFLINAVYFKADWETPFVKGTSFKQPFNTPEGAVETEFMHRIGKIAYFAGNGAKGVALPYADSQFIFFAMLPEGGESPREWLAKQDPASLFSDIASLLSQKADFTVSLSLPKFEVRYSDELNDELITLGMGAAFGSEADFSLLSAQHSRDIFISRVIHKTFIRVDEKGTEAAAGTAVELDWGLPDHDVEISFNRPFLYGILDKATGIPVFAGILEDPAVQG